MIIGISGKAGCGKSTVARLVAEILKGQKVSFADALRKEIFDIFGIPMRHMTASREYKDSMDISLGLKQTTLRELMQWWGMVRREQSLDYWVNAALANCKGNGVYVFDDVRFLNEFLELKSIGAPVFRIMPYPGWQPGVGSEHPSETDLDLVSLGAWTRVFNPAKGGLAHVVDTIVDMAREVMQRIATIEQRERDNTENLTEMIEDRDKQIAALTAERDALALPAPTSTARPSGRGGSDGMFTV